MKNVLNTLAASLILATASSSALAHVEYVDLSNGEVNSDLILANYGWFAGTTAALGDSHVVGFYKFNLTESSLVTLTLSETDAQGFFNPGFTLYEGLLFDEAHDDAPVDPLNPRRTTPPPIKIASPKDDGVTMDADGRVSPFRDTATLTFNGQFDALHTWSMGNGAGQWSVIEYIAHAAPTGGTSVQLVLGLGPGDYTVAAGGGFECDRFTCTDPNFAPFAVGATLSFNAVPAPVPEPGTWAMLLAGLGLVGTAVARRRRV